jgi:hypothetical protein
MKKILAILVAMLVLPFAFATSVGTGITPDIGTEDFEPLVWMCDSRVVFDDDTEPGRWRGSEYCTEFSSFVECGDMLIERLYNYAFEGEQIIWDVLVMDKNGIEKIEDVFATVGDSQGAGNDIEVNCNLDAIVSDSDQIRPECNARILEEEIDYISDNMAAYYTCIFTVETPESMYGEYWITVEATDLDGLSGTMDENEYWFLNPVVALSIQGGLEFDNVRPGTAAYSSTLLVENDADQGSGVMMDMFISGTDFYDSSSSGAKCPTTNQLALGNFAYFGTNGAYSTTTDPRSDVEGYVPIGYGIGFHDPTTFYNSHEIFQVAPAPLGYFAANSLSPGAEMALTFRLMLPEPCNGDFDTGAIYFWGEAI